MSVLGWMRGVSGWPADARGAVIPSRRASSSGGEVENLLEGLLDDLSTFGSGKPSSHYRKLAAAVAQLRNVGLSRNRMLKTEFSRRSIA
jgi:hypothetical protein